MATSLAASSLRDAFPLRSPRGGLANASTMMLRDSFGVFFFLCVWVVTSELDNHTHKKSFSHMTEASQHLVALCGERGIRTPGTVARSPHFECGPIDHSGISPFASANIEIIFHSVQTSTHFFLTFVDFSPQIGVKRSLHTPFLHF